MMRFIKLHAFKSCFLLMVVVLSMTIKGVHGHTQNIRGAGAFGMEAPSLFKNGSFEEGNNPVVAGWELGSIHPPKRSDAHAKSGQFSMHSNLVNTERIPSEGHLNQTVTEGIEGGEDYVLRFWVREIDFGISYVQQYAIDWLDATGESLNEGGKPLTNFRAGKKDWELIEIKDLKAPRLAVGLRLRFRFVTGAVKGGSGEVYIDDVDLLPVLKEPDVLPVENEAILSWRNGDSIHGNLLPSEGPLIRWSSPIFDEDLLVHWASLNSIRFPKSDVGVSETFRVATVSGELINVSLIGSDESTFLVDSQRHGQFRLQRESVYSLQRMANSNRLSGGSRFEDWMVALGGPVHHLQFKVFDGANKAWLQNTFPDFSTLRPVKEGKLASAYFDPVFSDLKESFAIVFEGQLNIRDAGNHLFQVSADHRMRFWVDGALLVSSEKGKVNGAEIPLKSGNHSLKLEYIHGQDVGDFRVWWSGPGFKNRSLVGTNREWGWREGPDGHPRTQRKRAGLFRAVELPDQFDLEIELASSTTPNFLLALGKDESTAESKDVMRLETRGNYLTVIQGTKSDTALIFEEETQEIRVRISYDKESKRLDVFDLNGRFLVTLNQVDIETGKSGLYVRNRGEDLIVRRVDVYQRVHATQTQGPDASKPRVHLLDGTVLFGVLWLEQGSTRVVSPDGQSTEIELKNIDRIVHPNAVLSSTQGEVHLIYDDGGLVRGSILSVGEQGLMVQTSFYDQPIHASFAGLNLIQFNGSPSLAQSPSQFRDQLFLASGRLRGQMSIGLSHAALGWKPAGVEQALGLTGIGMARIERHADGLSKDPSVDQEHFPAMLHLINGEIIPCRVTGYLDHHFHIRSPFIQAESLDAKFVKAVEFLPDRSRKNRKPAGRSRPASGFVQGQTLFQQKITKPVFGEGMDEKIQLALTIPRFRRDQPSSHLLIAKNGDIKRGKLVAIRDRTIHFESSTRVLNIPLERIAKLIQVQSMQDGEDLLQNELNTPESQDGLIRVFLKDGFNMEFLVTQTEDGNLHGVSDIYGELTIPFEHIAEFNLGGFLSELAQSKYESWFMRPGKEPVFED